jgi:hypothetical protein
MTTSYETGGSILYPERPSWYKKPSGVLNIIEAFDDVQVHGPGMWENELSKGPLEDWFAISTANDGIIAYFNSETDALSFRLHLINRWFNG